MVSRRLIASAAAIGLMFAAAVPVAAHDSQAGRNQYVVTVLAHGPSPDADLVNGWGIARTPTSPWWVADNGTDLSTVYVAAGAKQSLRVAIPGGAPTGIVYNPGATVGDFHGDAFLFAGEAGLITGWRAALGATAEVGNQRFEGNAVYKGLAIATADRGSGPTAYLYATDFHNRRIDIFDRTFVGHRWRGAFVDPKLPTGYGPFGIQSLNGTLFVTYAKTQPGSDDERAGPGLGIVDAFATNGTFLGRVASHGPLDAPWGVAWAPADFGRFGGDLIVGNFGDGRLLAYRWNGHEWRGDGTLEGRNDKPIVVEGLWGIGFGGGTVANGSTNTLFFAAGPDDEAAGAFGTVTVGRP